MRSVKRPKIEDSDRMFWFLIRRTLKEWRKALHFVKPAAAAGYDDQYVFIDRVRRVVVVRLGVKVWPPSFHEEEFAGRGPALLRRAPVALLRRCRATGPRLP